MTTQSLCRAVVRAATCTLAVLAASCPPFPAARCASDSDCPAAYICNVDKQYCQPLHLPDDGGSEDGRGPCRENSDCVDSNPCDGTDRCNTQAHQCEPPELPFAGFYDRLHCAAGGECVGGICRARDAECVAGLTLGIAHSCAVDFQGTLLCWGRNDSGQVGNGNHEHQANPVVVSGLAPVSQVAAGMDFTCALTTGGAVHCWGRNQHGQLGVGSSADELLAPQQVASIESVIELRARRFHACARLASGEVWCWGNNENGQLGDNTTSQRNLPVKAQLPTDVEFTAIAPGGYHTCALTSAGAVWCWGGDWAGQLGSGTRGTWRTQPEKIAAPALPQTEPSYTAIASGEEHSCALTTERTVFCWGAGNMNFGQLGEGYPRGSTLPVAVAGLTDVVDISVGMYHSCARLRSGEIRCWGYNHVGQLGDESHVNRNTPTQPLFSVETAALAIAAGGSHSCARLEDGAVYCWGDNSWGQIGSGDTTVAISPAAVTDISNVSEIAAGGFHTCAATALGQVYCWGLNNSGQLGIGSTAEYDRPQLVTSGLTAGDTHVRANFYHACAFDTEVWCWGSNAYGQLGTGDRVDSLVPSQVTGIPAAVTDVAVGYDHTCALTVAGEVYCWGSNSSGQIGDGTNQQRLRPTRVGGLVNVVELSARIWHNCARTAAGEIWCWGYDYQATPSRVDGLGTMISVAAGGEHSCAVDDLGRGWCWGSNRYGALGNGVFDVGDSPPVQVINLTDVAAIATSWNNTCARTTSGGVWCWGANDVGELGTGSTASISAPGRVGNLAPADVLSAGELHTCAVTVGPAAACWGSFSHGQLGNGDSSPTLKPVPVVNLRCGN